MSESAQRWETGRVEAFSDGVFAIAITLLVLEIHIAPADYDHLWHALLHEWPAYLAYVTSFLTVGSVWIAHHELFTRLRFVDPVLLRLNLMLLLFAAFLPFPTGVLAEAFHASQEAERAAIVFYGGTALLIDVLLNAAVRYARSKPELTDLTADELAADASEHERGWRTWVASATYTAAILVGIFTFPRVAAAGYLVVAVRGVFVVGRQGRLGLRILRPPSARRQSR